MMTAYQKYMQQMAAIKGAKPGGVAPAGKGLGFGPNAQQPNGLLRPYAPSSGINPARDNPNGITGAHQSNGAGFSGNKAHFITGALPQMNAQSTFDPTRGNYQAVTFDPNSVGNLEMAKASQRKAEENAARYQQENGHPVTANGGVVPEGSGGGAQRPAVNYGSDEESPLYKPPTDEAAPMSTPFLDAYMRATQRSQAEGPVTSTLKKYLEE